jgi:hypothetical protein
LLARLEGSRFGGRLDVFLSLGLGLQQAGQQDRAPGLGLRAVGAPCKQGIEDRGPGW